MERTSRYNCSGNIHNIQAALALPPTTSTVANQIARTSQQHHLKEGSTTPRSDRSSITRLPRTSKLFLLWTSIPGLGSCPSTLRDQHHDPTSSLPCVLSGNLPVSKWMRQALADNNDKPGTYERPGDLQMDWENGSSAIPSRCSRSCRHLAHLTHHGFHQWS